MLQILFLKMSKLLRQFMLSSLKNGDYNGRTKVRDIVLEEEHNALTVFIMLNRIIDVSVERNAAEPEFIILPNDPILIYPQDEYRNPFKNISTV